MYDAIYCRQSIDKKDSVSIEAQADMCMKYIDNSNYQIYSDKGFSGKSTNRPDITRLISDIKDGKVKKVVSYRLDRISRNIVDFANLINLFDEYNVAFISATENFDTKTPIGKAMVYMIMTFAQMERETIAGRIADNYRYRSETGKYFMGGNTPYGYSAERTIIDGKQGSKLIVDNVQATILKEIFKMYNTGNSIYYIAMNLNSRNILTSKNKPFTGQAVKRILQNITPVKSDIKIYNYMSSYGYNIVNREEDFIGENGMCLFFKNKNKNQPTTILDQIVCIGNHEYIITSEEYIKANIRLNKNIKTPKKSNVSFLAGIIKCKECGYSFGLKNNKKNGKTYSYYICRGRTNTGSCNNKISVNAKNLEKDILDACRNHLSELKVNVIYQEKKKTINYQDEIEEIQSQINNLIDSIGKGNSVVDELLTSKISTLNESLQEIKQKQNEIITEEISNENMNDSFEQLKFFDKLSINDKILLIRRIVEKIEIDINGDLDIYYLM